MMDDTALMMLMVATSSSALRGLVVQIIPSLQRGLHVGSALKALVEMELDVLVKLMIEHSI